MLSINEAASTAFDISAFLQMQKGFKRIRGTLNQLKAGVLKVKLQLDCFPDYISNKQLSGIIVNIK